MRVMKLISPREVSYGCIRSQALGLLGQALFLILSKTDILGRVILLTGGCSVYCRMFSSITGL